MRFIVTLTIALLAGCDFVGEVVSLGSECAKLQVGDQIAGLIGGGKTVFLRMLDATLTDPVGA